MTNQLFRQPRPLPPGGTIGVFAPSGVVNAERLQNGVAKLEALGYRVVLAPGVLDQWRYFAGTDNHRLASFHTMLANPSIDTMMMARGGYGWSRLLHRIDWDLVRSANKSCCGFSDFTAFQLGALTHAQLITYAGPGVATDFDWLKDTPATAQDHQFMATHCFAALAGKRVETAAITDEHHAATQTINGILWGSNLSLMTHLVGTPFFPTIENGIVFIEEIDEDPYAIERMLMQLFHAGVLQKQRALIFGSFANCEPEEGRFPYSLEHVAETMRDLLPYPVLTGLPFGHFARKLTIPCGAMATLTIGPHDYRLAY